MRLLRPNLLSGSLFYSEGSYSEEQQFARESEDRNRRTPRTVVAEGLPPFFSADTGSVHAFSLDQSPMSSYLSTIQRNIEPSDTDPFHQTEPLSSSPARLSPITSGPIYSLPVSSMPPVPESPDSAAKDLPCGPSFEIPGSSPPFTPHHQRDQRLLGQSLCDGPYSRPTTIPRFKVYDDQIPAILQPQTPADLVRRPPPQEWLSCRETKGDRSSTPSPVRNSRRVHYPATLPRLIYEPSTAELTAIPLVPPTQTAR